MNTVTVDPDGEPGASSGMETTNVGPALTPAEWAGDPYPVVERGEERVVRIGKNEPLGITDENGTAWVERPDTRHALAALSLWRATFGFSWGDVDRLRDVAETHAAESGDDWQDDVGPLKDLADRIAALLPPREGTDDATP